MLAVFGLAVWLPIYMLSPVRTSGPPVPVNIPLGANAAAIGTALEKAGVVRSATVFTVAARLYGESGNMKAGEYKIPPKHGVFEIIDQLVAGNSEAQWVVIPEGRTLKQIAQALEAERLADADEFLRAARRPPSEYGLDVSPRWKTCDGFLFPDSYKLPKQASARTIVAEMVKTWKRKVWEPNQELFKSASLTPDKIVVAASLIEREARVPQDRPLISSVIRNRLARKMKLQIDATVLFALGRHQQVVLYKDLEVDSPYNTYKHKGLPPGPICQPGLAAIEAALKPADEDYLFYVAMPDGSHVFTSSAAEHDRAVRDARRARGLAQ